MCYMTEISQRELRNDNAEIMRGVERGESYVVTRRGVPVARIEPLAAPDLACARPALVRIRWADFVRAPAGVTPTGEILDDLRGDR